MNVHTGQVFSEHDKGVSQKFLQWIWCSTISTCTFTMLYL